MVDANNDSPAVSEGTQHAEDDPAGAEPFGAPVPEQPADPGDGEESGTPQGNGSGGEDHGSPTFPVVQEPLTGELATIKDVLEGRSNWGSYLKNNKNLEDALTALQICWKYHPDNNGKNPQSPKMTLGDVESMREDLMHLSATGVRLAALAAYFESGAKAADNERKLARSRAWARVDREIRAGNHGSGRFTVDDKKNLAEASIAEYYALESQLQVQGRILSWVRASARDMVESFQVLIRSSMREERGDAKLN